MRAIDATQSARDHDRGYALPVFVWLLLVFGVVLLAVLAGGTLVERRTRATATEVASLLEKFGSVARHSRELGDSTAAFDRAVLAYLRTDSSANREAVLAAAKRMQKSASEASLIAPERSAASGDALRSRIATHEARGIEMLTVQDRRRASVTEMQGVLEEVSNRIARASAASSPAPAELHRSLENVRADVSLQLARGAAWTGPATMNSEREFLGDLREHSGELGASAGVSVSTLIAEDFRRSVELRRAVLRFDREIDASRREFATDAELLGAHIRDNVEGPAWAQLAKTATEARASVERSQRTIRAATLLSVALLLLLAAASHWLLNRPLHRLGEGMRRIAAGDYSVRARSGGVRELREVGATVNHLAAELEIAQRAVRAYQAQLEQRVAERTMQLRHLAEHDPLTNLPNRRGLFQRLDELVARAADGNGRVAVVFIDLDNFKYVNDNLGHEFGDRALTLIGERLRRIGGDTSFVARIGGDEFTMLFPFSGTVDELAERAEAVVAHFQQPLRVDRHELSVGLSCGAAIYPEHGQDPAALLRAADTALFRAKELGRNRVCVFDPVQLADASNRFRVEQSLRRAIEEGDLLLHFQPQVSLGAVDTLCVEALLRWRQGENQIVAAIDFIDIAEQAGLMVDLGEWVLDQALSAARGWRSNGWPQARVSVNVSSQQFVSRSFVTSVERLLERHALPPQALEIEVTEGMLEASVAAIETLRSLRALGVAIALDDFGTGSSSVTTLEQLPLTRVKLDRAVIAEVDWNPRAAAVAHSIVSLCRSLGLQVTVEGIERPSQLDFVAGCGDVAVQGYLIAPPAPQDTVVDFVLRTTQRVESLLEAAELSRSEQDESDDDGLVRLFRRKRSSRGGDPA